VIKIFRNKEKKQMNTTINIIEINNYMSVGRRQYGIKSKCCNAEVSKYYNTRNPGYEEEFTCSKCDKECDFYEDNMPEKPKEKQSPAEKVVARNIKRLEGKLKQKEKPDWEKRLSMLGISNMGNCECVDYEVLERQIKDLIYNLLEQEREKIKTQIVKEINIAQKEGQPTSRLTSLYNYIQSL
jgi:hypothetical protein